MQGVGQLLVPLAPRQHQFSSATSDCQRDADAKSVLHAYITHTDIYIYTHTCVSIYLFVCLSIYLSIYLPIPCCRPINAISTSVPKCGSFCGRSLVPLGKKRRSGELPPFLRWAWCVSTCLASWVAASMAVNGMVKCLRTTRKHLKPCSDRAMTCHDKNLFLRLEAMVSPAPRPWWTLKAYPGV